MNKADFNSRYILVFLLTLLIVAPQATLNLFSVQNSSATRRVSIDYLGKRGPATRKINDTEYVLTPQQAEWAQKLYFDKNYDTVTNGILELLKNRSESNSYDLFHLYETLGNIPDDQYVGWMKDVLNEWCGRNPESHIPWLVRGIFYLDLAWNIRGGGYASTVSDDSWKKFYQNLEWAKKDLEHSYKLNPEDPNSSCFLIKVALGLGEDFPEMEKHYLNVIRVCPEHYGARRMKKMVLLPQWDGSIEEMNAFADECLVLSEKYPYVGLIKVSAYISMMSSRNVAGYAGHVDRYLNETDVWSVIEGIYIRILDRYPDDLLTHLDYSRSAVLFDKPDIALDQLKIIGNRYMMYSFWPSLDVYDEVRTSLFNKAAGVVPDKSPERDRNAAAGTTGIAPVDRTPSTGQTAYPDARARQRHGDELARQGKNAEALAEYLWCFDEGMRKAPELGAVRLSFLLSSIARLGQKYPPALQQLRVRRDTAKATLDVDPFNYSAQADFAALNRVLGEDEASLAFYDQLPLDGSSRKTFGMRIWDTLLEARRYRDAVEIKPFDSFMKEMINMADMMRRTPGLPVQSTILDQGGKQLEALAGSGKLEQARELLKFLKQVDSSEESYEILRQHLERAGQEELLNNSHQEESDKERPRVIAAV